MTGILMILLVLAMLAVLGSLIFGLVAMAKGGEFNEKYGNKMMRLRVLFQGIAVVLFIAAVLSTQSG